MAVQESPSKHGIVRSAIREDLLQFALPGIVVFSLGLLTSARDGYDGLVETLWDLIWHPRNWELLSVPNIVGLAMLVIGLTVAFVAVGTLGRFYASTLMIRQDHRLITHGVYRLVRHPIYLGVLVVIFGVPAYASSLNGFLVMSVLIPIILNRIRIEERLLTEEFGNAYREYQETTKKLIPFIY